MQELSLSELTGGETQGKHLIFSICGVQYGIEIEFVTEIIGIQPMTPVPNTPSYVRGITNIRGTIVPVIDMRARFGLEEAPYDERTCIVLISKDNMHIGMIVDAVEDVVQLAPEDILPPPNGGGAENGKYLKAIGKCSDEIKQILDISMVFET